MLRVELSKIQSLPLQPSVPEAEFADCFLRETIHHAYKKYALLVSELLPELVSFFKAKVHRNKGVK